MATKLLSKFSGLMNLHGSTRFTMLNRHAESLCITKLSNDAQSLCCVSLCW